MRAALALAASLAACSGASVSSPPDPLVAVDGGVTTSTKALAYAPCAAERRVGQLNVTRAAAFTSVEGRVSDGVVPANVRATRAEDGACRLLLGRTLFCNPPCGAGQTCGEGGSCVPFPRARSVGEVKVLGLRAPLSMTPSATRFYTSAAVTLPHPAWADGDRITLIAAGGELPGFTLRGQGVPALAVPEAPIAVERGMPAQVTWTPAAAAPAARVRIVLDLAHHGGIAASVECDGLPDTGSFEVPASMVGMLLDQGLAGFPLATIARRTADSAELAPGCVELDVVSSVERPIAVPGLVSCTTDEECPRGSACGADLRCRGAVADGGAADAAGPLDASVSDAPVPDAANPDAANPDAANPDAANPDASRPDAGPRDVGPVDVGPFSFFVTSIEMMRDLSGSPNGFGGDLRFGEATGLAGADRICKTAADRAVPGAGQKVWRAYLSAAAGPVHAIERVGRGPWYDRNGRLVATSTRGLVTARPQGDPQIADDLPNERGEGQHNQPGPNAMGLADNHDVMTGSLPNGRFPGGTATNCADWTSTAPGQEGPYCGHSWPAPSGLSWARAHYTAGCEAYVNLSLDDGPGPEGCRGVGCAGGYGAIYCFALTP